MKTSTLLIMCLWFSTHASALTYPMPNNNDRLIGENSFTRASEEDTLVDIARRYDLGFDEIINANPAVDAWLPKAGSQILLPHQYLLPDAPHEGIVVNTAEMRLYYYPKPKKNEPTVVETFPISIGRSDWHTPVVSTKVIRKQKNPQWRPPKSVQEEHALDGDILPDVVDSGPDNPLGQYALYLSIPAYLIHGSNKEYGIGMQVTHGCMRMYAEDIEHLFNSVPMGTPVQIVNQPFKAGWFNNILYVEIHPWLEGTSEEEKNDKMILVDTILKELENYPNYPVDWTTVEIARMEANGQPIAIGPERGNAVTEE